MTFAALEAALDSRDDRAIDAALAALKDDPVAGVDAIDHVLATLRRRGIPQSVETRWNFRLAEALETAAATPTTPRQLAARSALRAALLQRDTLNDGEGTTRTLVLALMLGADDDESLRGAVDAAGGPEPAIALLEKGAKRSKGDDERIGRLRRALARVYELVLKDKERAFFEALKAARKLPADGLFVDDVYRLALDTRRLDEAAAFFGSLADDETLAPRARATAANKLGAVLEEKGDRPGALAAYIRSLGQHETKAARKKAERLQEQLEIATPLPPPVESAPSLPPTPTPMPPAVDDTAAHPTASPVASTVLRQPAVQPPTPAPAPAPADLALDASDIVAEEAVAPPPPPPADDDDEASVLVERGDRTVEHRDIPTMTMPPAPPPDDDDRDHDGPAWSPSSAVDDGPLPPPVAPVAVDDVPAPVTAERPVHAGFIVPPGAFDDVGHDDAQDLPPPARVPMPSPLSAEAPPATTVHAVPAAVTMTGSEPRGEVASEPASDERSGRHKKKGKPKKARRGHGTSDALEATAPSQVAPASQALPTLEQAPPASSSSSLVGETVPLVSPLASTAPPARALDFEPSIPLDRPTGADRISLGDELPEPARTTPGGGADAAPAAGVVAGVADVAAREATAPPVDEPKPARLLIPAPSPRDLVLARAQELLRLRDGDGDVVDFLTCAEELSAVIPGDPRVLRLAGRALLQSAPTGELPASGVDLVVGEAPRHGDRATAIIRDIQQALPPERRAAHTALWLAGARAAGHDVDTTHALLEEVAAGDGPDGPVFTLLDAVLKDAGDVDRRDVLHLRAWRSAERAGDVGRQIQILERRIDLLEAARRDGPALQAWTQLALEHPVPAVTRAAARRFVETKATPDERARFLARLARKLEGDEAVVVLRELLTVRVAVDDRVGAEATARDLLQRVPGDPQAVAVLAEILVEDPRRTAELVTVLRARADSARAAADVEGARQALERLARAHTTLEQPAEAAAALVEAVRLAPGDNALVQRVCDVLLGLDRVTETVDLLDELAEDAPLGVAARLWLRAADLARGRLKRLGRARELLEKSIGADDKNSAALDAHAELLLELGDARSALSTLERLAAVEPEGKARARVHLRIGRLLEEHLQRDDDALKRYRAAIDGDRTLVPAWEALQSLARRRGDKDAVIEALTGIAGLETGRARAAALVKLARLHEQERGDLLAAASALENALAAWPADLDALQALVAVRARALQGEHDIDAALAVPAPELVDEVGPALEAAEQAGATLPFALRRLLALGVTQRGDTEDARRRFEALLEERGDDLPTLLAFARHLVRVAQKPLSPGIAAAADERRREVLEAVLLHHAYALKPIVHVDVWGEVCALRLQHGDVGGARKAAKKALALIAASKTPSELESVLSDRAVRAFVLSLEDAVAAPRMGGAPADAGELDQLEHALRLDLERAIAPSEKARLKEKQARIAVVARGDVTAARLLLQEALRHDPDLSMARESLFDLELSGEDPRAVLDRSRALVATERDPQKKAQLHLRLFRLQRKLKGSSLADDAAAAEIKAAVELDPKNLEILETAEKFFQERKDTRGLDELFTTRLKGLDRHDVAGRTALLDRLAQLRRYEQRDLRGAIDACEAWSALDPEAIKPREDAARLHAELGQWKEAVAAWRAVLERDALLTDAWRGLFSVLARTRQGDEAFAVASTMTALEIADDDMVRAVRAVRPPFPRWPVAPADLTTLKKRLSHPLERSAVRSVLEVVAPRLLPRLGRPVEDFGLRRRDALPETRLPPSVAVAVRTAATLGGFVPARGGGGIPLYQSDLGATDGQAPPFAALPASEPGLIVTGDVIRGGMTPERAFALGRAVAWLSPWAVLAASLDAAEIRRLLESLVAAFLTPRDLERQSAELEREGAERRREILAGLGPTDADALIQALLPALRDWVVTRGRVHLSDWKAGVGYTGDRLGFLLAGDLPAAVKVIRSAGATTMATRLAIRELVLFSMSAPYLQLRRELSLAVAEQALAPILDLG
jgi:tetratricopeptide (TPR) repeat protein